MSKTEAQQAEETKIQRMLNTTLSNMGPEARAFWSSERTEALRVRLYGRGGWPQ